MSKSPGMYAKTYVSSVKRKSGRGCNRQTKRQKVRMSLQPSAPTPSNAKDYEPNDQKPDIDYARATVMQRASNEWLEERRARLTPSNFGLVCGRKARSNCIPPRAIAGLENIAAVKIEKCGLFVDQELPFPPASPDGLVGYEDIMETPLGIKVDKIDRSDKFWEEEMFPFFTSRGPTTKDGQRPCARHDIDVVKYIADRSQRHSHLLHI
ncbi:hypothetical protein J6590_049319 [Homalodisca vitripennis]|nr:hypothetical protein J6590_049319 [Homalodisca vitripennis]